MIVTIARVVRGEGIASAVTRTIERIDEALHPLSSHAADAEIINVGPLGARTGGIAVQLAARLREERTLRAVDLRTTLPERARVVHIEGMSGVPLDAVRRLIDRGVRVVISLHDFTPVDRDVLESAAAVIFASSFLRDQHRPLANSHVIEPSSGAMAPKLIGGDASAFAGSVQRHKGAHLLLDLDVPLHVFGGGDVDLLRALRRKPNVTVHGYYRARTLPSLLARHRVGLVLLPSIVPEAFSLVLSDAWLASVPVAAFDIGAQADRIRRHGGGWLAPLESGARGLMEIINGRSAQRFVPPDLPTAKDAARAHVALYRDL